MHGQLMGDIAVKTNIPGLELRTAIDVELERWTAEESRSASEMGRLERSLHLKPEGALTLPEKPANQAIAGAAKRNGS